MRIAGTLTTDLGAIDAARNGFVQDATGGIALRLDAALAQPLPAGSTVVVDGTLGSYFSLRVVLTSAPAIAVTGAAALPEPVGASTGRADETLEGLRLLVTGIVTEAPSALTDGLGVTIDDGSGPLRLVVATAAQAGESIATGDVVTAIGPLGQRDSSGTGTAGYRLHATAAGDAIVVHPAPSATPTPTPNPSIAPTSSPSDAASPTPPSSGTPAPTTSTSPGPTATPSASATGLPLIAIAEARTRSVGTRVAVTGVVTAPPGRLGTPALVAIQDETAGIVIRLPDDVRPALGARLEVGGTLADPYGQLEIRALTAYRVVGTATLPAPRAVDGVDLGEATEARLLTLEGTAEGRPIRSTSGDLSVVITTAHGTARIVADATAGLSATFAAKGDRIRVTGVAGQHASRKGALDGYRVWVRGPSDVIRLSSAAASASPSGGGTGSGTTTPPRRTIAAAILAGSGEATLEGAVTAPATLLDASHRRIVIQDATGAIEVLLPLGSNPPAVGRRIRVGGEIGRAYGAPRIKADTVAILGSGARVQPVELRGAPGPAHEWRLVSIRGDILEVHRSGERWTAELQVAGVRVLVVGLPGARIPSSALGAGRTATVVGIVRRPYPSASDRRFAILPRSGGDVRVGGAASGQEAGASGVPGRSIDPATGPAGAGDPIDADLVELRERIDTTVRVGGLVESTDASGFTLDDGTAVARVELVGAAADLAGSIVVGDALNATGRVVRDPVTGEVGLEVSDPAGIVLAGDLGNEEATGTDGSGDLSDGADESSTDPIALRAGLADPATIPGASAAVLVLLSMASLAITLLRRKRMREALATRVAARLAGIRAPSAGTPAAVPPDARGG